MPAAVITKASMAGSKRKAEMIKEEPSKGSKKPKIDSLQSRNPRVERNGNRQEKTAGIPVPKSAERVGVNGSVRKRDTKIPKSQATKPKGATVKEVTVQALADSSDEDFDGIDDDGGVALDDAEDSYESEEPLPTVHQGVHPDRVKANVNGAGPNGTILNSVLAYIF
jgi:hypothetical protein